MATRYSWFLTSAGMPTFMVPPDSVTKECEPLIRYTAIDTEEYSVDAQQIVALLGHGRDRGSRAEEGSPASPRGYRAGRGGSHDPPRPRRRCPYPQQQAGRSGGSGAVHLLDAGAPPPGRGRHPRFSRRDRPGGAGQAAPGDRVGAPASPCAPAHRLLRATARRAARRAERVLPRRRQRLPGSPGREVPRRPAGLRRHEPERLPRCGDHGDQPDLRARHRTAAGLSRTPAWPAVRAAQQRRPHAPLAQAATLRRAAVLLPSAADSPRVSPRVSGAQATDTPAPTSVTTAEMIIVGPMPSKPGVVATWSRSLPGPALSPGPALHLRPQIQPRAPLPPRLSPGQARFRPAATVAM